MRLRFAMHLVVCKPECQIHTLRNPQGVSGLNRHARLSDVLGDSKNRLAKTFYDTIEHLQPPFLLMEQVPYRTASYSCIVLHCALCFDMFIWRNAYTWRSNAQCTACLGCDGQARFRELGTVAHDSPECCLPCRARK